MVSRSWGSASSLRLGDSFHGIYDPIDVPYTIYEIYTGEKKVGYIHGVNQKGQYGGIQVFIALDLEGRIKCILHPEDDRPVGRRSSGRLRQAVPRRVPQGLRVFDPVSGKGREGWRRSNPAPEAETDFYSIPPGPEEESHPHG